MVPFDLISDQKKSIIEAFTTFALVSHHTEVFPAGTSRSSARRSERVSDKPESRVWVQLGLSGIEIFGPNLKNGRMARFFQPDIFKVCGKSQILRPYFPQS